MSVMRQRIETIDPPTATLKNRFDVSEVTYSELLVWRNSVGVEVRKAELAVESDTATLEALRSFQELVESQIARHEAA